jgi:TolA-binding protein
VAKDDDNSEENLNPKDSEVNEGEPSAVPEYPQHVTRAQWAAMFALSGLLTYLYFIWPNQTSSEEHLKDPKVYVTDGRHRFEDAHTTEAFPRDTRLNAFQDVEWQFSQARRAGGDLELEDIFRWGYSSLQVALGVYPGSHYAMVRPLELLEEAKNKVLQTKNELLRTGAEASAIREELSKLSVHPAKINFALAKAYLEVGRVDKAIPLLDELQTLRHQYEQSNRLRGGENNPNTSNLMLGASPYLLQLKELQQVGWMLGKGLHMIGKTDDAIQALNAYLESTRPKGQNIEADNVDREIRFHALKLLSEIQLNEAHRHEKLLRNLKGKLELGDTYTKASEKKQLHLQEAYRRLKELFVPEYQVYGLDQQHLMLVETCVKLGKIDEALALADTFENPNPDLRNEMKLWKTQAQLQKDPSSNVSSTLESIAGDNTKEALRLAALVMLGDMQVDRNMVDITLGSLVLANQSQLYLAHVGAYEKATSLFPESAFDDSTIIDKFKLIETMMVRAHKAEKEGDEDLAIRLYRFLLKEFTVKSGSVVHGIAKLQRIKGQKLALKNLENEKTLREESKHWFQVSAESFLETERNPKNYPFEKATAEEALFQAAESYFEGGFYTKAYDTYEEFMTTRPDDNRITKARHKKGISALYRKDIPSQGIYRDPFSDARQEFLQNISSDLRPRATNKELPIQMLSEDDKTTLLNLAKQGYFEKVSMEDALKVLEGSGKNIDPEIVKAIYSQRDKIEDILNGKKVESKDQALVKKINAKTDEDFLDKVLAQTDLGSRDIWAYNSMLELGMAYYAEHRYNEADKVFNRIRKDGRFNPASEIWRKASYAQAKMTWDRVAEKEAEGMTAPWNEAIDTLEDLLMLYDLKTFSSRFYEKDTELYKTFQRENAHIKFLLAKALLKNKQADKARLHTEELLNNSDHFDISILPGQSEKDLMVSEQKTQALLGDCLYSLGLYTKAMEQYRRAHDRNLESAERPFYSLSIVDCLLGLGDKKEAINRLKRIKWEFENFYKPDPLVFKDKPEFSKNGWIDFVDRRLRQIQDS